MTAWVAWQTRRTFMRCLPFLLLLASSLPCRGLSQEAATTAREKPQGPNSTAHLSQGSGEQARASLEVAKRVTEVKKLYDTKQWSEVVRAVPESPEEGAELQLYRGLALARLDRWDDARETFEAGLVRYPGDARFLVELAGIAYHEKDFATAKRELRKALELRQGDEYSNDFLASIYFQEGNLEAALRYWNRAGKPKLTDLTLDPQPKLNPLVLDRAFAFSRGSEWRQEQYLKTDAQLQALDLYPVRRFGLRAETDGSFDLDFHASERNGWGETKWEGLLSLLRDVPYQAVDPEFYNLGRAGLNWVSTYRWDDEKRRLSTEVAAPMEANPAMRYRLYFDGRNENWDIANTLLPSNVAAAGLNLEKVATGAEMRFVPSGLWQWSTGVEYSYRRFRNVVGVPAGAAALFADSGGIALNTGVERSLVRLPERRFTVNSSAKGELGTFFAQPLGRYGRLQGALDGQWFPKARREDYEMRATFRGGKTFGGVPFDELFTLGFDRDTELWMRGHPGLLNGEKGNAPLGRNYVLANWEMDKIVYGGGFLTVKAGPFVDSGKTYDPSGYFGSPKWLWDTGIQARIRVLGGFVVVVGWGKDLRSGRDSLFTTVGRGGGRAW
jgi:tetratricopeptide (TPR) repeat protein